MFLDTSPHDPSGFSPNDPAVLVGRIEEVTVEGNTGTMSGHLLATDEGQKAAETIEQMGRMGVSIDVDKAEVQITPDPTPDLPIDGPGVGIFDLPMVEVLTKGEIMGATVCPFPAFAGAYIVLGDGSNAPGGDLPKPTPEQASMAIRYVDSIECEPCAAEQSGLAASAFGESGTAAVVERTAGAGPLAPPRAWFENPKFGRPGEDPRLREMLDSKTGKPSGKYACPITVTPDGEYYGHVAAWGVCHQSPSFLSRGQCVLAPRSNMDYAWFHGRGSVLTAEGDVIDVGRISADIGHASTTTPLTAAQAIAHYDNSALTAAVCRAGEDEYGIWVHGSVHPAASAEQVFTLRACPPSGDWRPVGHGQELVAILHVNEPGFPIARATIRPQEGKITSLVAAGVPLFEMPRVEPRELSLADRVDAIERGIKPALRMARDHARDRMAVLREGRI